jgi:hypothetical protein
VSEWEPTGEQICIASVESVSALLKLVHRNPSLAGLDKPKLPTRSQIEQLIMDGVHRLHPERRYIAQLMIAHDPPFAREDEPDVPEFTEDDVRELALAMWPGNTYYDYNQTAMDMARRVLAAGYRKAKQ